MYEYMYVCEKEGKKKRKEGREERRKETKAITRMRELTFKFHTMSFT